MTNKTVFTIEDLVFRYDRRIALRCQNVQIFAGESVAFVGPNGTGKTSLLKLMNGLIGPYDGRIEFFGVSIRRNALLRKRSVYVHQHPILFAGTVRDNLIYALKLKNIEKIEADRRIAEVSERCGLGALLSRQASRLSGGETQRVALARAIAGGVDILLLDEPTSSMDEAGNASIAALLSELKKDGTTLIFSTHERTLADSLGDRCVSFAMNEMNTGEATQ